MVTFYPRIIHKMQPLDGVVFGSFKTNYNIKIYKWMWKGNQQKSMNAAEDIG